MKSLIYQYQMLKTGVFWGIYSERIPLEQWKTMESGVLSIPGRCACQSGCLYIIKEWLAGTPTTDRDANHGQGRQPRTGTPTTDRDANHGQGRQPQTEGFAQPRVGVLATKDNGMPTMDQNTNPST